jgi:hypothetical protein
LTVNLKVVLPEEKQPRKISIGNNEVNKNDSTSAELLTESV